MNLRSELPPDAMLVEEHAVTLVAAAMTQTRPAPTSAARPNTDAARRRIVEDARTLLGLDPAADSVVDLARRIGTSPITSAGCFTPRRA